MSYLILVVMILLALVLRHAQKEIKLIKKYVLTKLKDLKATVIK